MTVLVELIARLLIDIIYSWLRMFAALFISIGVSFFLGVFAARSSAGERIILPLVDVFQTLPILAFFPIVIFLIVGLLPGYIGINAAVIFLIITSMVWNIIFGVYESIKTMPKEFLEVAATYQLSTFQKLIKVYAPAALPRVAEQSVLSWSIGLFYLVTSEIFSAGNSRYEVQHGIGVALTSLAGTGQTLGYIIGIFIFILFVVGTRFLFFVPLQNYAYRYSRESTRKEGKRYHFDINESLIKRFSYLGTGLRKMPKSSRKSLSKSKGVKGNSSRFGFVLYPIIFAIILVSGYVLFEYPHILNQEAFVLLNLVTTFARVWSTFILFMIIAVPLSAYIVFIARSGQRYLAIIQILSSIPATIILPAIAYSLKNGELVAIAVFFLSGIWYVIFSAVGNLKNLNPEIMEVKKIFGIDRWKAWKNIYLKALLPGLVTGSVTAIAAEWNASIVAEYFTTTGITGSGSNVISTVGVGIGKLLDTALASGNFELMLLGLLNLTAMILLINTFIWKRLYRRVSNVYK